jgi:hypothetical protein
VLLGGAYTKTPIDLSSGKGALEIKKPLIQNVYLHPTVSLTVLLYWLGSKYGMLT